MKVNAGIIKLAETKIRLYLLLSTAILFNAVHIDLNLLALVLMSTWYF